MELSLGWMRWLDEILATMILLMALVQLARREATCDVNVGVTPDEESVGAGYA